MRRPEIKIVPAEVPASPPLETLVGAFFSDLENSGRSRHTLRNYASDLRAFGRYFEGRAEEVTPEVLRGYFQTLSGNSLATRARHQASLNSFFQWCLKNERLGSNPISRMERIRLPEPHPKGLDEKTVERILSAIPRSNLRDRLLFTLIAETGLRASEATGIYYEDLDLTPDDEKVVVKGKGSQTRTVMLYAAPETLKLLKRYLNKTGIRSGALFRGNEDKGGSSRPLHYRTAHHAWRRYCERVGARARIHDLRHSFATSLVNSGVRIEVVRKLLGHKNMQTTLRYAEVNDQTIKSELIGWVRRRKS